MYGEVEADAKGCVFLLLLPQLPAVSSQAGVSTLAVLTTWEPLVEMSLSFAPWHIVLLEH